MASFSLVVLDARRSATSARHPSGGARPRRRIAAVLNKHRGGAESSGRFSAACSTPSAESPRNEFDRSRSTSPSCMIDARRIDFCHFKGWTLATLLVLLTPGWSIDSRRIDN